MEEKICKYVEEHHMLHDGDTVIVGVSGGADSVALLFVLLSIRKKYNLSIRVVHIHHGLREEAEEEANYVRALCDENQIPFTLIRKNVTKEAKELGLGTEEAGRSIRYQAFEEEAKKAGRNAKIAVAHNMNDRAETMLFHLFRGSGPKGLASIKPIRAKIIRPLLCVTRAEIEKYLNDRHVHYCIDKSNLEDTYTRNRIRNHLLPVICQEVNSNAVEHISSAAALMEEMNEYISKETELAYQRVVVQNLESTAVLNISSLKEEDVYIQKCVIRRVIDLLVPFNRDIGQVHIEDSLSLADKEGNKKLNLPYGIRVTHSYNSLILTTETGEQNEYGEVRYPLDDCPVLDDVGKISYHLDKAQKLNDIPEKKYTKCFDYGKINESLFVRHRQPGDYFTVNATGGKKKLKDYFIDEKVPVEERKKIWLIADGSHILWVIGYRISEYYKVTQDTKDIIYIEIT